jgi:RHS repeat-associated protein
MGRVSKRTLTLSFDGAPPAAESFVQGFAWTALGLPASVDYPRCSTDPGACLNTTARNVNFTYTRGWLTAVPNFASDITYSTNGLSRFVTHTNGIRDVQDNDLNSMQRPRQLYAEQGPGGARRWDSGIYQYDEAGNVLRTGSAFYLYDKVSRLKTGSIFLDPLGGGTNVSQSSSYDAFGNILAFSGTSGRSVPTDSNTNRMCTNLCPGTCGPGCGGTASYSAAGELLGWNTQLYEYDALGMINRTRLGAEDWLHVYTADDERVWSYKVSGSGAFPYNRWTLRGLDGQILREYQSDTGGWSIVADYVYRDGLLLAAATPTETRHFHLDHLGTPRAITNTATPPARIAYHAYYPFGEEATSSTQDSERLRFTAHEIDFNAQGTNPQGDDLNYMHARHHSPLTGRFLQPDPIGGGLFEPQSWNRYEYVLGRPLVHTDPRGLWQSPPPTGMTLADYGYAVGISVFSGAVRVGQQPTNTPTTTISDPTNALSGIVGAATAIDRPDVSRERTPIIRPATPCTGIQADYASIGATVGAGMLGLAGGLIVDRNGNVYLAPLTGGAVGKSAFALNVSATLGTSLGGFLSASSLTGALSGWSNNVTLALGYSGGFTRSGVTGPRFFEMGVSGPAAGVSSAYYWKIATVPALAWEVNDQCY